MEPTIDPSQLSSNPTTKWDKGNHPLFKQLEQLNPQPEEEVDRMLTGISGNLTKRPANRWLKYSNALPVQNMLFSEFWMEGEVCILFADTNLGKSILAVQVADSISKGEPVPGFKLECKRQPVLYFDFELSAKQFEARYSNSFENHYLFDDEFSRVEINPCAELPEGKSFEEYLRESVEHSICNSDAKVIIIDNITYLRDETRRVKNAMNLMKQLQVLKNRYRLSVLVVAHSAKRTAGVSINSNDVQGSKSMMRYCDSAFCIGENTADRSLRYLKQVKTRSSYEAFGTDNVAVCQVMKPGNFLKFEFLHSAMEWELLKGLAPETRQEMIARIIKKSMEGKSQRQIAAEVGVSVGAVNKYLKANTDAI